MSRPAIDRFWEKVDKSGGDDACWLWGKQVNHNGYGIFHESKKLIGAHRWILGFLRGSPLRWDDELKETANHKCNNPPCVNPVHLYIGNQKQNVADAVERGSMWWQNESHRQNVASAVAESNRNRAKATI